MATTYDKTIKSLLGAAIAILYTILVYFFVNTIFGTESAITGEAFFYSSMGEEYIPEIVVAALIAVFTLFVAVTYLRGIFELLRGLVAGAGLVLFAATLLSFTFSDTILRNSILIGIFIVLSIIIYAIERSFPEHTTDVPPNNDQTPHS